MNSIKNCAFVLKKSIPCIARAMVIIAIIGFFVPFCVISCQGEEGLHPNAYRLAVGTKQAAEETQEIGFEIDLIANDELLGEIVPGYLWIAFLIILPLCSIGFSFIKNRIADCFFYIFESAVIIKLTGIILERVDAICLISSLTVNKGPGYVLFMIYGWAMLSIGIIGIVVEYVVDFNKAKSDTGIVLTYMLLSLFAILAIAPLLWLALNSFKTSQDYQMNRLGLPNRFFWQNYTQAWQRGHFGVYILNSIFYTAITTVAILALSFMSGFAFAKINNRNTKWMYGSYVVGILMTLQSIMIPLFIVINQVGLYDTKLGVLIPYIGIGLPMGIYLATEFMKSIPNALVESARLDGAHYGRIFISIMAPMAAPVGVTIAILQISGTWNEFMLINMLTSSTKNKSLPVGIQSFAGSLSTDYGKLFASLMIGLIPMLVFYIIFRKEITKGVSAGAVKG